MRLVVLGCWSAAVPAPGGRGSGYLVTEGKSSVLLDCGNGVLGELARHGRIEDLSAVALSHLHHDHVADLYALALFHKYAKRRIRLLAPAGTRTLLYRWFSLFTEDVESYVASFDLVEYEPWKTYEVGVLRVTPCPVDHGGPVAHALRVESGEKTLLYSGDSKDSPLLEEAARGADLFLCEATYTDPVPARMLETHLSASAAGALARRAGAKRLVLTHFLVRTDPAEAVRQASATFEGPVEAATEGRAFEA